MTTIPLADGRQLAITHPLVMGIINCTPDSFAVRQETPEAAVECARRMIAEGADILDIGGESSRPGSDPVSADRELSRVLPVISAIRSFSDIPLSVDTTKAVVAEKALTAGVNIINDISALSFDEGMAPLAARAGCPVVLMHMQGKPKTMQQAPYYDDVISDVCEFLAERMTYAIGLGIAEDKLILDVGIGFGKRTGDNLTLLKNLNAFRELGRPLLVGASRKRFIGDISGVETDERLPGSLAVAALAAYAGVAIVRVHDVAATKQAVAVAAAIREV